MNKLVTVLGVAAVATLAGCKDPNYKPFSTYSNGEVKVVEPEQEIKPIQEGAGCKCAPGTMRTAPCRCGAADCTCESSVKPGPVGGAPACGGKKGPGPGGAPACGGTKGPGPCETPACDGKGGPDPKAAPAPEYTVYIVQNGDYLAKISKRYNISIAAIKKLNNLKDDKIRIGQKIKLPGKVEVGEQKMPAQATGRKLVKPATEYTGETKEYVVKSGDTLGAIAYGNGINIRQLKKLNGLTADTLKVGQKLKIPANGKASVATSKSASNVRASVPAAPVVPPVAEATPVVPTQNVVAPKVAPVEATPVTVPEVQPVVAPTPAVEPAPVVSVPAAAVTEVPGLTYTVQEGDDMTGVSIRYGVSSAAIRELNNLPEDAQLTVGQTIKLPPDAQQ